MNTWSFSRIRFSLCSGRFFFLVSLSQVLLFLRTTFIYRVEKFCHSFGSLFHITFTGEIHRWFMIYSHTNIRLSHCIKLVCEDIECDGSVSVGLMRERVGDRDPSTENGFMTCTVHLSWIVSGISEFLFNDDYWIGFPESISIKSVAFALLFVSNADRKISRT